MPANILSNRTLKSIYNLSSYTNDNPVYLPLVSAKSVTPIIFSDRQKYSSRSYWSATDINNPQKKTCLTIENHPIEHQGINTLDIVLEYSYDRNTASIKAPTTDLIFRQINLLLLNYPNEEDFWEVMNCYLTEQILRLNSVLCEITITIAVHPNSEFPYYRSSTVTQTNCGSKCETWHFNFPFCFTDSIDKSLYAPYKVNVDYIYATDSSQFPYPDFMIIYRQIADLLITQGKETWSKTQHSLKNILLQENSTLRSVSIELERLV